MVQSCRRPLCLHKPQLTNANPPGGFRASGWSDSLEEAQEEADESLIQLLRRFREDRLAGVTAEPYRPQDKLGLDVK